MNLKKTPEINILVTYLF